MINLLETSFHIRAFIVKVILMHSDYFEKFKTEFWKPLAQMLADETTFFGGFNSLVKDIISQLVLWSTNVDGSKVDLYDDSLESRYIIIKMMRVVCLHCGNQVRFEMLRNVALISHLIQCFSKRIVTPTDIIYDQLQLPKDTATKYDALSALYLCFAFSSNGLPIYSGVDIQTPGLSEGLFYKSIVTQLSSARKDIFIVAAELIGHTLESFKQESHTLLNYVACAFKYPPILTDFGQSLLFILPQLFGSTKALCLETLVSFIIQKLLARSKKTILFTRLSQNKKIRRDLVSEQTTTKTLTSRVADLLNHLHMCLLQGLDDTCDDICNHCIPQTLKTLFVSYATRFLLGPSQHSAGYDTDLFSKSLKDGYFVDMPIDTSWINNTTIQPLFLSQENSNDLCDLNVDTNSRRQFFSSSNFQMNSLFLHKLNQVKSTIDWAALKSLKRKHEERTVAEERAYFSKETACLKQNLIKAESLRKLAQNRKVKILCNYRTGKYPDVQIKCSSIIKPLEQLEKSLPRTPSNQMQSTDVVKKDLQSVVSKLLIRSKFTSATFVGTMLRIFHMDWNRYPVQVNWGFKCITEFMKLILILQKHTSTAYLSKFLTELGLVSILKDDYDQAWHYVNSSFQDFLIAFQLLEYFQIQKMTLIFGRFALSREIVMSRWPKTGDKDTESIQIAKQILSLDDPVKTEFIIAESRCIWSILKQVVNHADIVGPRLLGNKKLLRVLAEKCNTFPENTASLGSLLNMLAFDGLNTAKQIMDQNLRRQATVAIAEQCDQVLRWTEAQDPNVLNWSVSKYEYAFLVIRLVISSMMYGNRSSRELFPRLLQLVELFPDTKKEFAVLCNCVSLQISATQYLFTAASTVTMEKVNGLLSFVSSPLTTTFIQELRRLTEPAHIFKDWMDHTEVQKNFPKAFHKNSRDMWFKRRAVLLKRTETWREIKLYYTQFIHGKEHFPQGSTQLKYYSPWLAMYGLDHYLEEGLMMPGQLERADGPLFIQNLAASAEAYILIRSGFAKSWASLSIASYIMGIGDRHTENFLVDLKGIDFGYAFGSATEVLPVPELVPFRLTRQIKEFMGPLGIHVLLEPPMVDVMTVLQEKKDMIMTSLDIFVKEPLMEWRKFAISQYKRNNKPYLGRARDILVGNDTLAMRSQVGQQCADVREQVRCLIDQATDPNILGRAWRGWLPFC
ncbi:hypothetical protein BSLG_005818 [Batrachochytrium salamandrivorans]|nr:hypothetical protein BSLG_005818 [Batrachochytrium salamandrivorans]